MDSVVKHLMRSGRGFAARWLGQLGVVVLLLFASPGYALLLEGDQVSLAGTFDVLLDPSNELEIEDVQTQGVAKDFVRLEIPKSFGYQSGTVWLRLTLARQEGAASNWLLDLNLPLLDEAQLYEVQANGRYAARAKIGTEHPFSLRDVPYRSPIYRLELPDTTPRTYYLRLRGDNSLVLAPRLWTISGFVAHYGVEQMFLGAFVVANLLILLGCLRFWQATRDRTYALLSLFIICSLGQFLAIEGLAYKYLFPNLPGSSDVLMVLFWLPSIPLSSMFMLCYSGLREKWAQSVTLHVRLQWLIVVATGAAALSGYFTSALIFYQVWSMVQMAGHLLVMGILALAGSHRARTMAHAALWLTLGVGVRVGRNFGWLPATPLTDQGFHWSFLIFLVVLYLAAIRRYEGLWKSRAQAQAQALDLYRQTEQRLEIEVAKRTADLQEAYKLIEVSWELERQAREEQRQFFTTVSHELRTPLAVIDATVMNLQLDMKEADEAARLRFSRIRRAIDQLAELVRNCFQEARFTSMARGVQRDKVDMRSLIYDAHDAARMISTQHNMHIEIDDLPETFICDPELTRLALRTLASNAVKYTPPGTNVVLTGRYDGNGLVLEVQDDGPGVSPSDLPNLFRRYYRGQNAGSVAGTGLGLPLAHEMIEAQGGRLTVESLPQKGFLARIWLPSM